jgi:aryl-alcohol dehydrogenase-like predicted oxidoreductase
LERRPLGKTGLEISRLVFGGNVFGWTIDEPTSLTLLDAFVAAGFNCIDTADIYSNWKPGNQGGESETIIGRWLKRTGRRDKVVIATKVGYQMDPKAVGLSKKHIIRSAEGSLARLQTDYIDLYQAHLDDTDVSLEETLGAFDTLIRQGKVRAIGTSNHTANRLAQALQVSAENQLSFYQTVQPLYNLYDRFGYEGELESLCQDRELGVIPYAGLASGFLTGKYRSEDDLAKSVRGNRAKKYLTARGFKILGALDTIAGQVGAKPGQVALSWLLVRASVTAPIVSATSLSQLDEIIASTYLTLDPSQLDFLAEESA